MYFHDNLEGQVWFRMIRNSLDFFARKMMALSEPVPGLRPVTHPSSLQNAGSIFNHEETLCPDVDSPASTYSPIHNPTKTSLGTLQPQGCTHWRPDLWGDQGTYSGEGTYSDQGTYSGEDVPEKEDWAGPGSSVGLFGKGILRSQIDTWTRSRSGRKVGLGWRYTFGQWAPHFVGQGMAGS